VTPRIRRVTPDDVPTVVEIERECFVSHHWSPTDFLHYDCLVAELDGRIAGFLVSRETFGGSAEARREREVLNLAVTARFRRLGVASALLEKELQKEADHFLEVRASNSAAQSLYKSFGFKEVAQRPDYYDSPVEPAIVMIRKWC
jgi:[ribosomal protein S18]-alanine N-acetyltransferase